MLIYPPVSHTAAETKVAIVKAHGSEDVAIEIMIGVDPPSTARPCSLSKVVTKLSNWISSSVNNSSFLDFIINLNKSNSAASKASLFCPFIYVEERHHLHQVGHPDAIDRKALYSTSVCLFFSLSCSYSLAKK